MKRKILVISLFSLFFCNGQVVENTEDEILKKAESFLELFYNTEESIEDNDSENPSKNQRDYYGKKANEYFSLLIDKFPNSERMSFYLFSKGSTSSTVEEAKTFHQQVIELNNWSYYTRKSCLILASLSLKEKNLENVLYYLKHIEKMGKPTFTSGMEKEIYETQLTNLYEEYNKGIKK